LWQINRILAPSGYLFLWIDKYHLCEGINKWLKKFDNNLQIVDMITWNKQKIGMGYRTRRKCEYLLVLQKKPVLAKSTWSLHNIPDVWEEKVVKTHVHSKPVELQKQLILATTKKGDFVCDPASGGYSVLKACIEIKRNFIGGDIEFGGVINED
jgi:site-specific DNA-methyltransferase (adenine-specific)